MPRLRLAWPLVLLCLTTLATRGAAQDTTYREGVRIGLTYTPGTRPGVLVLPSAGALGDSVRAILQRDFDHGDRIAVIGADAEGIPIEPRAGRDGNYPVFQRLGAAALVQATITGGGTGVHVALHDVAKQQVARVRDFPLRGTALSREWRMTLHAVADELEAWITGVRGIAATRIAYVSGNSVFVVDSDGHGATVVSGGARALSPAWHPRGTHLAWSQLGSNGWSIVVRDLGSGSARTVGATTRGLNITPTFSPDGNVLVYSHSEESGADLFATPAFENGPSRRITVGRGSDNTSPTFSPDGRRIAFTTGRLGRPEVYISDADGTNPDLLTAYGTGEQNYRSDPDWSPDGRLIAFQAQLAGRFQIMTIGLRDRAVKQHTSEGTNEAPSWAPDSRHLVFSSTRSGAKQLYVLDTETGRVRQITFGGGVSRTPSWSPALAER